MAGSSIFVTYGLKAGGGAPFLRRTRNSFGQAQQKTSTAFTGPQLQARVNNCIVTGSSTSGRLNASHGTSTCFSVTQGYSGSVFYGGSCTSCGSTLRGNAQTTCFGGMQASTFDVICACTTTTFRGRQGFSGWFATGSCGATYGCCNSGCSAAQVECRTVQACQFPAFPANWSNVGSCTTANPACSNGAVSRQCQTVFSFREQDWSVFEEAETCITSSPTASSGAVQVECIAN